MAFLRVPLIFLVLLSGVSPASGHMGKGIDFLSPEGHGAELAAHVVAAYMGEQMGRDIKVKVRKNPEECLESLFVREAPIALVHEQDWEAGYRGLVKSGEFLPGNGPRFVLVMGEEAAANLQFSLVQKYLARLSEGIGQSDMEEGIRRVRGGEGPRKVALDLLREADLL